MAGTVIAIANQKGGVGKTTTCLELAQCLADKGRRVIVVDFDMQGNATDNMGAGHEQHIMKLFRNPDTLQASIQRVGDFDIIASSEELSQLELEFSSDKDRDNIYVLSDMCSELSKTYDYVIIDNTPARNMALNMAYVAADIVVCPTEADKNSIEGIVNIEKDIKRLREARGNVCHAYIKMIIVTKVERSNVHDSAVAVAKRLAENLPGEVLVETVRKSVRVHEIKTVKGTLQKYDKYCSPAMDYRRIADKIITLSEKEK